MAEPTNDVRTTVQEISLGTGYRLQKPGPDHTGTNHSCPVDAQGSNGEKYTSDLKWKDAHGTGHGKQTKRSPGPNFHESRTAYIYANHEEIQKLAMKTHLEVQQREDIRRDLAERMKFVPPDLRAGENVFYWQEDPNNIQKVDIIAIRAPWQLLVLALLPFRQK